MSRSRTYRPSMECLEARCVPSTFTVKNLKDGGPNSLRQAIFNAEAPAHPGADTIVFKPGLAGTIKLTSGMILISDSLVIAGPGAAKITVNGTANGRIFQVDGAGADKDVTIRGLRLFNGKAFNGGAIENRENLTLVRTVITGNHADSIGGGLTTTGRVTIRNSVLSGNTAGNNGGGLYADGNVSGLTIKNSRITGNHANLGQGGGLFTLAALSTVKNTKITANTAKSSGGGLSSKSVLEIDRCTISGNTAQGMGRGGGIRQAGGSLTLTNSTVSDNHADGSQGGGIFVNITATGSSIRGCTIAGNTAAAGGGVWSENNILAIDRSTIRNNTALTGAGGGIAQQFSFLRMTSSTVRGNHADQNEGGGILLLNITGASTIQGSTISANTAFGGGGLAARTCPNSVVIQNSTISGNRATEDGGGIYLSQCAPLTIQNSTIAFNKAGLNFSGGGIQAGATVVSLESTIVAKNRAAVGPDLHGSTSMEPFFTTFSLIGSTAGANFFFGDATTNALIGRNPLLAPLAFNGGPTKTHALKAGSPAINKGSNPALLASDQRGLPFKRVKGLVVDIGAFERQ